jgi:hypothetical protein
MAWQAPHHSLGCVKSSEADLSGRHLQPALGFGLPARVSDGQLMKLCGLQVHDLITLAAAAPHAISYNKGRRMWRLVDALLAAVGLRR